MGEGGLEGGGILYKFKQEYKSIGEYKRDPKQVSLCETGPSPGQNHN
jgi:hypothetical protein